MTPDRLVGQEVIGTLHPAYLRTFYRAGVRLTPDHRVREIRRSADELVAVLRNEYTGDCVERIIDQVVVEHGTLPNDDVYTQLKADSVNDGELDLEAFSRVEPQTRVSNPDGRYRLIRIGDAVASRNIHAAILDGRRAALSV